MRATLQVWLRDLQSVGATLNALQVIATYRSEVEPTRGRGPGYPYDPRFDYGTFAVNPDVDGTLLSTGEASRQLHLESTQAVRNLVAAGRLPALRGSQPRNKRHRLPLWAVRGLAHQRKAGMTHLSAREIVWQDATADLASRTDAPRARSSDELARLRSENADLRFAWAAMREAQALLAQANEDRQAAMEHLREAEKRNSSAADSATKATRLLGDALTVYVMPADNSGP